MIYMLIALITLLPTTTIYTQWSATSAKDLKQPVNFSGRVTTYQGQEFNIDNISINGKYAKISMPLKPENLPAAELNSETKKYEVKLSENPNTEFLKRDVDLEETSEIKVPSPDTIYVYQKKERSQKIEFLEVEVISKSNTKYSFLLESRTPIYCDGIDSAGPQETTIPLSALKTLTIEGFTYRDTSADKNKKCKPNSCPPCNTEKQE
jgi:hypothetical protein